MGGLQQRPGLIRPASGVQRPGILRCRIRGVPVVGGQSFTTDSIRLLANSCRLFEVVRKAEKLGGRDEQW